MTLLQKKTPMPVAFAYLFPHEKIIALRIEGIGTDNRLGRTNQVVNIYMIRTLASQLSAVQERDGSSRKNSGDLDNTGDFCLPKLACSDLSNVKNLFVPDKVKFVSIG